MIVGIIACFLVVWAMCSRGHRRSKVRCLGFVTMKPHNNTWLGVVVLPPGCGTDSVECPQRSKYGRILYIVAACIFGVISASYLILEGTVLEWEASSTVCAWLGTICFVFAGYLAVELRLCVLSWFPFADHTCFWSVSLCCDVSFVLCLGDDSLSHCVDDVICLSLCVVMSLLSLLFGRCLCCLLCILIISFSLCVDAVICLLVWVI